MYTTAKNFKRFGILVGLIGTVIALFAFAADSKPSVRNSASRYDGWDDSLGI